MLGCIGSHEVKPLLELAKWKRGKLQSSQKVSLQWRRRIWKRCCAFNCRQTGLRPTKTHLNQRKFAVRRIAAIQEERREHGHPAVGGSNEVDGEAPAAVHQLQGREREARGEEDVSAVGSYSATILHRTSIRSRWQAEEA